MGLLCCGRDPPDWHPATAATKALCKEAAMGHVRDVIFAPKGTQSWEGVELAAYWETVGKLLMTQRLYAKK